MNRRGFAVSTAALVALLPTVAKGQDASVDRYTGSVVVLSGMMGWLFTTVGELTTDFTEEKLADEVWRVDVLAPFAIARAAQDVMLDVAPPPAFQESYDYFQQAIDATVEAGWAMTDGVLGFDTASLTLAAEHTQRAQELINLAVAAIPAT